MLLRISVSMFPWAGTLQPGLQRLVKGGDQSRNGYVVISEAEDMFADDDLAPRELMVKFINGLIRRMSTTRMAATPRGREARQFLTFFVTSLFNPMLQTPPPLVQMSSWTTLVPVYQEDIIYALEVSATDFCSQM